MRRRPGFTLVEVLVVLAILLALAAVVLPQVAQRADATDTAVLSSVTTAANAIGEFKADTRRYPGQLAFLADASGTPTDICGDAIPAGLLARWSGPYLQRRIPATGLPAGDAVIVNQLERADPAGTTLSHLVIKAAGVTQRAAESLDAEYDGVVDLGAGSIQWSPAAGNAPDTLRYYYPIRGC